MNVKTGVGVRRKNRGRNRKQVNNSKRSKEKFCSLNLILQPIKINPEKMLFKTA